MSNLGSNEVESDGALSIAENLHNLTVLDLGKDLFEVGNNLLRNEGAIAIAKTQNKIRKLNLADNVINDEALEEIAVHMPQLIHLDVCNDMDNSAENSVGEPGVLAISTHLKSLTKLSISIVANIT